LLTGIYLASNRLNGTVPSAVFALQVLEYPACPDDIEQRLLTNTSDEHSPMSALPVCDLHTSIIVSALQQLRWLDLLGNRLTGTLSSAVRVGGCGLQACWCVVPGAGFMLHSCTTLHAC
jgi:hypothetical protein